MPEVITLGAALDGGGIYILLQDRALRAGAVAAARGGQNDVRQVSLNLY